MNRDNLRGYNSTSEFVKELDNDLNHLDNVITNSYLLFVNVIRVQDELAKTEYALIVANKSAHYQRIYMHALTTKSELRGLIQLERNTTVGKYYEELADCAKDNLMASTYINCQQFTPNANSHAVIKANATFGT